MDCGWDVARHPDPSLSKIHQLARIGTVNITYLKLNTFGKKDKIRLCLTPEAHLNVLGFRPAGPQKGGLTNHRRPVSQN